MTERFLIFLFGTPVLRIFFRNIRKKRLTPSPVETVQKMQLVLLRKKRLILVLPVNFQKAVGQFLKKRRADRFAVYAADASAVIGDSPGNDQIFLNRKFLPFEQLANGFVLSVKHELGKRIVGFSSEHLAVDPSAERGAHGTEENRFAGAGFTA